MAYDPNAEPVPLGEDAPRLSMLLWGEAGCGKTTLAATAPGRKLWILLDPDGDVSIKGVPDILKIDLTGESEAICSEFTKPNPFKIKEMIEKHKIDTVVFDSLTRASELALRFTVNTLPSTYKATLINPTQAGYGARNLMVVNLMHYLLRATAPTKTNIIFITHEGAGDKTESGQILSVSMLLGGQLPGLVAKDISEVWNMQEVESGPLKGRRIGLRPERLRRPMKSRMFDLNGAKTGFEWKYNTRTREGITLASLWDAWAATGYDKLEIP